MTGSRNKEQSERMPVRKASLEQMRRVNPLLTCLFYVLLSLDRHIKKLWDTFLDFKSTIFFFLQFLRKINNYICILRYKQIHTHIRACVIYVGYRPNH